MRNPVAAIVCAVSLVSLVTLLPSPARACPQAEVGASCVTAPVEEPFDPSESNAFVRFDLLRTAPTLRDAFSSQEGGLGVATALHGRLGRRTAVEFGFELAGGKGVHGLTRYELGLRYPEVLVYLNPESRTQVFFLSGFMVQVVAFAQGDATTKLPDSPNAFVFLGGVLGVGVEEHTAKDTAYTLSLRAYARARIDGKDSTIATDTPEFHQATRIDTGVVVAVGVLAF